ncbi:MAG: NusG domain II-containing protein [Eubacteriales bacterium]|nr:NusG domain II-containing protein [Eubacteriales bacterium]
MLKKKDGLLIGTILIVCLISYVLIQFVVKKDGNLVLIKVDGAIKYQLKIDEDKQLKVSGYNGGENIIVIKDGAVRMSDADCPDKLCVNMGSISRTGETIVCLPHRVVVEIAGNQSDIDSVVQ